MAIVISVVLAAVVLYLVINEIIETKRDLGILKEARAELLVTAQHTHPSIILRTILVAALVFLFVAWAKAMILP